MKEQVLRERQLEWEREMRDLETVRGSGSKVAEMERTNKYVPKVEGGAGAMLKTTPRSARPVESESKRQPSSKKAVLVPKLPLAGL